MVEREGTMFEGGRRVERDTRRRESNERTKAEVCDTQSHIRIKLQLEEHGTLISSHVEAITHYLLGDASQRLVTAAGIGLACATLRPISIKCVDTHKGSHTSMQCLFSFDGFCQWHRSFPCLLSGTHPNGMQRLKPSVMTLY